MLVPSRKVLDRFPKEHCFLSLINPASDPNPATRVRQFSHLRGSDLSTAVKDLEQWEQVHELDFHFNDFDALLLYLIDVEQVPTIYENHSP